jgi:hypothetical protein
MPLSDGRIKAAQARWELELAILQEEEKRVMSALEEHSRRGAALPREILDRLKAARSQCNEAFQALMASVEARGAGDPRPVIEAGDARLLRSIKHSSRDPG